jgi:Cytochrome c
LGLIAPVGGAAEMPATAGASIYLRGVLGTGAPLEGTRRDSPSAKGAEVACVNCHQRSGLGTSEGYNLDITIPPITGLYLFHARGATSNEAILPYVEWMHGNRDPYTEATLARAIREGVDSQGRPLHTLMPRFILDDADMGSLIDYLKQLGARPVPGVADSLLHFATIITPDTDPARRRAMLAVMDQYFADKNVFPLGNSRNMRTSGKTEYAKSMFMSHRQWQLHVWELTGTASTWAAQLDKFVALQPVLAVVSGLGGSNWAPVQQFCERQELPCLFPNVEVPVDDRHDFYSLYFSRGVLLEADLIARQFAESSASASTVTVRQLYRAGDRGEAAAAALAAALKSRGIAASSRILPAGATGHGVAEAVNGTSHAGALVLWLRPEDLSALGDVSAAPASVFMSGLMGGLEHSPLPPAWRSRVRMAYPYDLPQSRDLRMRYPLSWFSMRHIQVVDEELQTNTFLACGLLAETLSHMADNFAQPFIVELLQTSIERRLINTGYYPRLALGSNQHFASKGGYIVHFAPPDGSRLVADSDWVTP